MNRFFCASLAAAALLASPAAAITGTLTINPITATWSNVAITNTATLQYLNNGSADAGIRWGDPATANGKSGYQFKASATPLNASFVVDGTGGAFTLGEFTHINRPIYAPSITGARLTINYGVTVGANNIGNYNAVFDFLHDETTNSLSPCPYGGANGQGVNINGCADRVTLNFNSGESQFFSINGVDYSLFISDFVSNNASVNTFTTLEDNVNKAQLRGRILASTVIGTGGVPEPESWAMMLLGFGAIGIMARRRDKALAA